MTPADVPPQRPTALRAGAGLVGLQAAAGMLAGAGFVVAALVGRPADQGTAVLLGVLLSVYGGGVALVARGLWRGRRWARTPAYLVEFFAAVVAVGQLATLPAPMAVLLACAVAAAVALSLPSSRDALR